MYPRKARRREVQGLAVVTFVVEKDGSLTSVQLLRDPGAGIGEEALRVVNLMVNGPPWTPGIQEGKPVRVQFNLPIQFSLN
ncbi:energy transducer TonB [Lewinella sp. JB7]|uniref:energy transducer TonB n=1 Tax=Lewinella sp. JB7 TaxID=2962887 RepID=UPI0020CA16AB|nr:energy transducer TonB [Lewinella sp. JB7]MCP9237047.1 energy transducer TonB [Lewinella sp. JB7]